MPFFFREPAVNGSGKLVGKIFKVAGSENIKINAGGFFAFGKMFKHMPDQPCFSQPPDGEQCGIDIVFDIRLQ